MITTAEARARLVRYGPNTLAPRDRLGALREILHLLADPMAVMLVATAVVYFALGEKRDGVVMLVALAPILAVDAVLELRSRAALRKLALAVAPRARVVRGDEVVEIPTEEIVPGDRLLLREGDVVHADGVISSSANLSIDESSLTGESEPQSKAPEAAFYAGSRVLAGHGQGEVTETGARTRFGDAARLAREAEALTPLQRRVRHLVTRLSVVAVAIAIAVLVLALVRGEGWARAFLASVSLAMSAIPEELPVVFALFLGVGAFRLGKHGMLVRRLASVETLGSTTVICTDKTGTLTRGHFELETHVPLFGASDDEVLRAAVLACEPEPVDPMERAILDYARRDSAGAVLVRDWDFDPIGKHMSHVWRLADGRACVVAKGALEGVLAHCTITSEERAAITKAHDELGARAMRILAVAQRFGDQGTTGHREDDERDLRPIALLGFRDPVRPEVPRAVDECQRAGVAIKMITGDHALTAHAIAHAAGIAHADDGIVTGDELDAMNEAARTEKIGASSIFARIGPRQKHAIVDALRKRGEIVAMTGDGINDAPALRRADIGISMGERGTEVARAAADLVLLHDDFASIVGTIREGRQIYANIQSAFLYILAFHVPIVTLALFAPLVGFPLLLQPIHLVWLELVVHPVSALVFQLGPPDPDVMKHPPRDPKSPLLPRGRAAIALASGALLAACAFGAYALSLSRGEDVARAAALVVLMAGYVWLVVVERRVLPWKSWLVVAITAASFPIVAFVPPLARAFHVGSLPMRDWIIAAAIGTAAVVWRFFTNGARGSSRGASRALPLPSPRRSPT
jgi:Ca2+-transporting ATPase